MSRHASLHDTSDSDPMPFLRMGMEGEIMFSFLFQGMQSSGMWAHLVLHVACEVLGAVVLLLGQGRRRTTACLRTTIHPNTHEHPTSIHTHTVQEIRSGSDAPLYKCQTASYRTTTPLPKPSPASRLPSRHQIPPPCQSANQPIMCETRTWLSGSKGRLPAELRWPELYPAPDTDVIGRAPPGSAAGPAAVPSGTYCMKIKGEEGQGRHGQTPAGAWIDGGMVRQSTAIEPPMDMGIVSLTPHAVFYNHGNLQDSTSAW
jgi:hypothetical protein